MTKNEDKKMRDNFVRVVGYVNDTAKKFEDEGARMYNLVAYGAMLAYANALRETGHDIEYDTRNINGAIVVWWFGIDDELSGVT